MKAMTNQLTLRAADISEAEALIELTHAAFAEYELTPYPSRVADETAETIRGQMATGDRVFVVERGADNLACVRCHVDGDALYFYRLAVHPSARRQGIARMILAYVECVARAEGRRRLTCCVRERETGNVALYKGAGFHEFGEPSTTIRGGNPVVSLNMEKVLMPFMANGRAKMPISSFGYPLSHLSKAGSSPEQGASQ
jgi:ribosomal protein S18 acetylase RimI-like enzyme